MTSLEYVAGFFDGEGCVGLYTNGRHYIRLKTQLCQNEGPRARALFEELQERFGGSISSQATRTGQRKLNWQLASERAAAFLRTVLPFLLLKRDQAALAIDWQSSRNVGGRGLDGRFETVPVTEHDREVATQLKRMKKSPRRMI